VIYTRYSSEQQRTTSIDDQIRLCKEKIAREGWTLVQVYRDAAMSGATPLRAGYQAMLEGAREATFDVVVAEALDRLSRDQEDIDALFKRLQFAGIRLVTLGEGEVGRSGGGNAYRYNLARCYSANGEPVRGGRTVDAAEAEVVREIFSATQPARRRAGSPLT
jgi:DNA invertase Pin-like site-specific DNA recombinase